MTINQESRGNGRAAEPQSSFNAQTAPAISLPKGGGAIRGIGEKFGANPVTGTGSLIVPIATSPGRSGFGPQLSLSYDSGSGNGPFGLGWSLGLPAITRKTDKGLPRYRDPEDSDDFILSGAEDLVPTLVETEDRWVREVLPSRLLQGSRYAIQRYRPRIEGLFARIERWTNHADTRDTFWRSISKDNITTWYGKSADSRLADPADASQIFSWLICESHDDKGNVILYEYKEENSQGVDLSFAHERNRTLETRSTNRYLKSIKYGNREPYFPILGETAPSTVLPEEWLFEVMFDYGEHDAEAPSPGDVGVWPIRNDPFSSYRAGFEVRTYRLCQRVLMFHHFPDEEGVGANCLVRSTDFTYSHEENPTSSNNPVLSFINSISQTGYKRSGNGYLAKSLPPIEFEYTQPEIQSKMETLNAASLENLPYGFEEAQYKWVDLDGEGLSGILTEQARGWFYKRNLSPITTRQMDEHKVVVASFAPLEQLAIQPSLANITSGQQQLIDLAGDGQLDLVQFQTPTPGFFERSKDELWETFRTFKTLPNLDWRNPNLKFIDLTGDGHTDIMVSEDEALVWYPSLGESGFGPGEKIRQALDEEKGPRLVFNDSVQSIHLADMSGDGLNDLVRIRNGEVCYWPNLGYGRFGSKVNMDNAPIFDTTDQFDLKRIRLADIDGSGVGDIIYLKHDGVHIYFNQSGNSWSQSQKLVAFPHVDGLSSVQTVDLLGNGTACLVWSSALPGDIGRSMRYTDLMGGQKPHLLVRTINNLGAETLVKYAPSTKFYLADKLAGKPWLSKIPFPVHVIEKVETYDRISKNRFVTRYAYHHGYFDGNEREFRGFGMVEQWDTETFAALAASGEFPVGYNIDAVSHIPPVHTKTWFHTGIYIGRDHVSDFFAGGLDERDLGEYYREPAWRNDDVEAARHLLDDTLLPAGLTTDEEREACRVLKGSMLRREIYAQDSSEKAEHPYSVVEQNFAITQLQPKGENRHAVFFTHPRETVTYNYERNPVDPRIQHALTVEVDNFGNTLKSIAIGYGRRQPDATLSRAHQANQIQTLVTYTENTFTNAIDLIDIFRTPLLAETRTYELTGYPPTGNRFQQSDFVRPDPDDPKSLTHVFESEIQYEQQASGGKQRRLIERVRTFYRPDDLGASEGDPNALSPLGELQPSALSGESYKLAFTPELLAQVLRRNAQALLPSPADILGVRGSDGGGYVDLDLDGHWWIPSGRVFMSSNANDSPAQELAHARQHFFLPHRYRDPFHTNVVNTENAVAYDVYDILMLESRDPLGNRITAGERLPDGSPDPSKSGNDYRVLQPHLLMDPNRNRSAVAFDVLGMVVGTALMGKPEEALGDTLAGFEPDLTEAVMLDHLNDPLANPHDILSSAATRLVYDLFAYQRSREQTNPQPAVVYTLVRETHESDLAGQQVRVQHNFAYSDGFGREIQKKIQAEPGPVPRRDADGRIIVRPDHQPELTADDVSPRWVGSGWTVFNNKGKPVRQYEPFFTDTHRFEFDIRIGFSPVLFYDPLERVVATLYPNHTWEKIVFNPWRQETWAVSDTVLIADPKTDADVADFFRRQPDDNYLPVWHAQRQDGTLGAIEQDAARKASVHAATPTIAHADSLGRSFLTIVHNKFKRSDASPADPPIEEFYRTRTVMDIEGNRREVLDAEDRLVMRYDYDMLGNSIHQASMEAGERWILNDVTGKPLYAWDSRNHRFRTTYDPLRRPTGSFLSESAGPELLTERTVYGESQANPESANLRGKIVQVFDQAGVVSSDEYDFKGNLLRGRRQLAAEYKTILDWSAAVPLEAETYANRTRYDALNRPTELTAPDNSRIRPAYNEANLLERLEADLRDAAATTLFIADIDYDAKGQRRSIDYGNGVRTIYEYDPLTFRLAHLLTLRNPIDFPDDCPAPPPVDWPGCQVQNLHYTYDPAGNITHIKDDAQQTIYFRNRRVEPSAQYTYDAVYRLIEATGREHLGQIGDQPNPPTAPDAFNGFHTHLDHPGDGNAMGTYVERYVYDAVGNILSMQHRGSDPAHPGWTRTYAYNETSQLESARVNNRLSRTTLGADTETYRYDGPTGLHGNITRMPHLSLMRWDHRDQLQATSRQVVNDGTPEITWYVYDAAGQRVRKVTERQAAAGQTPTRMKERIYLGGFEIYREYENDTITLERETLHLMDDKQRIALVETRTDTPALEQLIRYQFGNHLGSASLELDHQARIISYEEYFPYGSTSFQAVRSQTETPKRYRYTGKERDEETGFQLHGLRYYCPWLGRWTKTDPAGLADGVNRYAYARGNPVGNVDSEGTQSTLSGVRGGLSRADEPEAVTQPAPIRNVENTPPQLGICRTDGRYTVARPAPIRNVEDTAPQLKPLDPRNAGPTPQEKFDKAMSEIEGLRRPVGNTGLAPSAAAALAPGVAARAEAAMVSALAVRLTNAIKAAGIIASTGTTVESHDDPDAGPAILGAVLALGAAKIPSTRSGKMEADAISTTPPFTETPPAPAIAISKGQGKHIIEPNYIPEKSIYIPGRSILSADPRVLSREVGTGIPVGSTPRGQPGFREDIDFNRVIGYDRPLSQPRWAVPTTMGRVHYNAKGEIHIVPVSPRKSAHKGNQ